MNLIKRWYELKGQPESAEKYRFIARHILELFKKP